MITYTKKSKRSLTVLYPVSCRRISSPTPAKPDFVTAAFGVKSPIVPAKPQQPEKPKVDVSGVAVGSAVAHAKFGIGKVIELNRGYVTVRFEQGEKRFIFPDAFESGFLKAQ